MQQDLGLTPLTEGLVASSLLFGAAFGALFGGRLADRNGRRGMIMVLAVVFLLGTLGCTFAPNTEVLIAARFILGLAVGGASVTVPVYLAEISPRDRRGRIVTQNELMIVTGQLLAFIFNAYVGNSFGESHGIWRWMLVIATLPAIALWIGMNVMPESPRWLASTPLKIRGLGMGASAFLLWIVNFLIGFGFPQLLAAIGISNTFFVFAVLGVGAIAFAAKYVPETKDKSLEDLEHYFKNVAGSKAGAAAAKVPGPDQRPAAPCKAPMRILKGALLSYARACSPGSASTSGASSGMAIARPRARSSVASWTGRASSRRLRPVGVSSV